MEQHITILGIVRPKKNSKQIVYNPKTKRRFVVSSANYTEWQKDALWQLKGIGPVTDYPIRLEVIFYLNSRRATDMDNLGGSIADVLQDAGILANDDCYHVSELLLKFGGVDKYNPRAEITLRPLK